MRRPSGKRAVVTILSFVRARDNGLLDDETVRLMGEAFEAACALLGTISHSAREAIADRIIDAATNGERDPIRLRDAGMAAVKRL